VRPSRKLLAVAAREQQTDKWLPNEPAYGRYLEDTPNGRIKRAIPLGLHRTRTLAYQKLQQHIATEGINDKATFVMNTRPTMSFREQARIWIKSLSELRRRPVRPATIDNYQWLLDSRLLDYFGEMPISDISNGAVKKFVDGLIEEGRVGAKTIKEYVGVVKLVVASAIDKDGDQLCPRKWNHDFIGMPIVDKSKQRRPTITASGVEQLLATVNANRYYVLFAALAGLGLRVEEILALRVSHISDDGRIVHVRRSIYFRTGEDLEGTKTAAAIRDVDVPAELAALLRLQVGLRTWGYLFTTKSGRPLSERNVLRMLHRKGIMGGFRMFRRFRVETLRKAGVPEHLIRYWIGHSSSDDEIGLATRKDPGPKLWGAFRNRGCAIDGCLRSNTFNCGSSRMTSDRRIANCCREFLSSTATFRSRSATASPKVPVSKEMY
jgi:integrase